MWNCLHCETIWLFSLSMKWGKWKKNLEMIKTEMKCLIYSLKFICKCLYLLAHECCSLDRFVTFWRVCSFFLIIIQIVLRTLFFVHKSIQSFVDPQEILKIFKPSLIKIIIIIAVFVSIFRVYNTYLLASFNLCGCFSVVSHCARAVGH